MDRRARPFVDYQNDVHLKDLGLAVSEGYGHVELAKRYTTNGMATDQGKLSNINAIGILAEARKVSPADVGTTTFRPFYTPLSFGALTGASKGKHFQPVRKSPLHDWAKKNGAVFVETGLWYRSSWFPKSGETTWRESVDREVLNVRRNAGICDVSTLGKIEIFGTDAAEFLNRIYCNAFLKLPVGKARYGLMLREDGMIYDDGTTSRLGETHFFMTTTTAYAAGVMNHLEFCAQALWPDLDVQFASSTDQWARVDAESAVPDVLIHVPLATYAVHAQARGVAVPDDSLSMTPNVTRPRSRGRIWLGSPDPDAPPLIDYRFFTDPEGHDERMLVAGVRMARRVAATEPMAGWLGRELFPGDGVVADRELSQLARETCNTVYHVSCTCRIGAAGDPLAVLAPDLRVRGTRRLSVADASAFPSLTTVNPVVAVLMLAERAAELVAGRVPAH